MHLNHRRTRSSPCNQSMPPGSATNNGARVIRVPISTFPPTAMVYSVNKLPEETPTNGTSNGYSSSPNGNGTPTTPDYVSAAIMAKVLEERSKERSCKLKCYQCKSRRASIQYVDETTQTTNSALSYDDYRSYPARYRSESSSSMDSLSNYSSNSKPKRSTMRNETIII